jgi:hypothetical protein
MRIWDCELRIAKFVVCLSFNSKEFEMNYDAKFAIRISKFAGRTNE